MRIVSVLFVWIVFLFADILARKKPFRCFAPEVSEFSINPETRKAFCGILRLCHDEQKIKEFKEYLKELTPNDPDTFRTSTDYLDFLILNENREGDHSSNEEVYENYIRKTKKVEVRQGCLQHEEEIRKAVHGMESMALSSLHHQYCSFKKRHLSWRRLLYKIGLMFE